MPVEAPVTTTVMEDLVIWFIWFVSFIWFIWFVSFNQKTKQTKYTKQTGKEYHDCPQESSLLPCN
jgi:hypothetical protein